jgi:hypothetical protein
MNLDPQQTNKFSIQWNNEKERVLSPRLGHQFSIFAKEGLNRYVELDVSRHTDLRLTIDSRNYEFELWIKYHDRAVAKNLSHLDSFVKSKEQADEVIVIYPSSGVEDHFLRRGEATDVILITLVAREISIEPVFFVSEIEVPINLENGL